MSDAWAGSVFEFEEIEGLKLLPLAARRALDVGGFRLSLEGWQSLALKDREGLVIEGAKDTVDPAVVEGVVRRSSIPATRIRPVPDPDPLAPPEQLNAALTSAAVDGARAIDPASWSRLRALDRYALIHVLRRSIAHDDVHRLETAVATVMGRDRVDKERERERSSLAAELKRTLKSAMNDGAPSEPRARESARPPADKTEKQELPTSAMASVPQTKGWRAGFSAPDIEITNGLPVSSDPPPAPTAKLPASAPEPAGRRSPPPEPRFRSSPPDQARLSPEAAQPRAPSAPPPRPPGTPHALPAVLQPRGRSVAPEPAEPVVPEPTSPSPRTEASRRPHEGGAEPDGSPPTTRPGSEHPAANLAGVRHAPGALGNHVDQQGHVHMVDVGSKDETLRRAKARGSVRMQRETAQRLARNDAPKGEVLATARIAGIMAAKRTSELIPLCHAVALTHVEIHIDVDANAGIVSLTAVAEARDRTGVEMEALTAVTIAALTIYDMLKGIDREIVLGETRLLEKTGGKSGPFKNDE